MVFLTCPESFSTIPDIFQNGDLKYFEVATTPPYLRTLTAHPTPILRGSPGFFFHQNDRKGCKRDVLDARGHFLLRFCAAGDKPSGGWQPPPLVGRGLKCAEAVWNYKAGGIVHLQSPASFFVFLFFYNKIIHVTVDRNNIFNFFFSHTVTLLISVQNLGTLVLGMTLSNRDLTRMIFSSLCAFSQPCISYANTLQ